MSAGEKSYMMTPPPNHLQQGEGVGMVVEKFPAAVNEALQKEPKLKIDMPSMRVVPDDLEVKKADNAGLASIILARQAAVRKMIDADPKLASVVNTAMLNIDPTKIVDQGKLLSLLANVNAAATQAAIAEAGGDDFSVAGAVLKAVKWVGDKIFSPKKDLREAGKMLAQMSAIGENAGNLGDLKPLDPAAMYAFLADEKKLNNNGRGATV